MPPQCCAIGCRSVGGHKFPKEAEIRKQWEIALRRKNFKAKPHSRLCHDHFRDEDYIKEGYHTGLKLERKVLKHGVIPSLFVWNEIEIMKAEQKRKRKEMRAENKNIKINADMPEDPLGDNITEDRLEDDMLEDPLYDEMLEKRLEDDMPEDPLEDNKPKYSINTEMLQVTTNFVDMPADTIHLIKTEKLENPNDEMKIRCSVADDTNCAVEVADNTLQVKVSDATTSTSLDSPELVSKSTCHVGTQKNYQFFCIDAFMKNNKAIQYYTGLQSYEKFQLVLSTLCPEAHSLKYRWSQVLLLSVEDQFLLTLIKLKTNKQDFELSFLFDISTTTVSNVFVTWVNFMHQMWSVLNTSSRKDFLENYIPEEFTNTTTQADGTEDTAMVDNRFNNRYSFAVGVTKTATTEERILAFKNIHNKRLKVQIKTFSFLQMQKPKKYFGLITKARLVCEMLCNFMESKV